MKYSDSGKILLKSTQNEIYSGTYKPLTFVEGTGIVVTRLVPKTGIITTIRQMITLKKNKLFERPADRSFSI